MKPALLNLLACPVCGGEYRFEPDHEHLVCMGCGKIVKMHAGIPLFDEVPPDIRPTEKSPCTSQSETPWRLANQRFLKREVGKLAGDAVIVDVGAGIGYFSGLFSGRNYFTVDLYPYPGVDLVCDLTRQVPFRPGSLDAILMMNVLEHLSDAAGVMRSLSGLLKPGGVMIATVPFLVKIHQAPYDFARYTHYLLEKMGRDAGLAVDTVEGYYDPVFLASESTRYFRYWTLPKFGRARRIAGRALLLGLDFLIGSVMKWIAGEGYAQSPHDANNPAPVGYLVVYRKQLL